MVDNLVADDEGKKRGRGDQELITNQWPCSHFAHLGNAADALRHVTQSNLTNIETLQSHNNYMDFYHFFCKLKFI